MKTIPRFICPAFAALAVACFTLLSTAQAVSPSPDGGYPGGNTAEGSNALLRLTTGVWNTAIGQQALVNNTTGTQNTATGYQALVHNTTGSLSTAYGSQSLYKNDTGRFNTAAGFRALYGNINGDSNTANGFEALVTNSTGHDNTATGFKALYNNGSSILNTADGSAALYNNTHGNFNTASGSTALYSNTDGNGNTAIGGSALMSNTTGDNNIALGSAAGRFLTMGDFNIDIGNDGVAGESNTIRIGDLANQSATYIAGINGTAIIGDAVVVDGNGQLGTVASAARFKKKIRPMDTTSEAILALKPVTFQYKSDSKGAPQFGLIAEEVAKIDPDLVVRDRNGEIYSVRYDAVNAMLLNEFLKEHRKVEEQQAAIDELQSTIARQRKDSESTAAKQQKEIQALTAGLQKVSAQLEASKPVPQTVLNNQ